MYRYLYRFTLEEHGGGIGATTLLHVWAYDHIPILRTLGGLRTEWARSYIFSRRWDGLLGKKMDIDTYRSLIDRMEPEVVIWRPYRDCLG